MMKALEQLEFYNNRQICIFLTLLEADRPVTSEELAKIAKTSVRTVKDEIHVLKDVVRDMEAGLSLVSKPGLGYYLQCGDKEAFRRLSDAMFAKYRSASVVPTDFQGRINYIIRRFLTADTYLKVDDFADGLYVNRRSLAREMKAAREMLGYYGIRVETKPGYGMKIKADEYHLRICMVDYFEFYLHKVQPSFRAEGFLEAFDFDFEERLHIRKILMKNLEKLNIVIPDYCSQKLVIHLLLMRSRAKRGSFVNFSVEDIEQVRRFPEYGYAERILEELKQTFDGFSHMEEEEITYFAIHLATGRDMLNDDYSEKDYSGYYARAVETSGQLIRMLETEFGLNTEASLDFCHDLQHVLMTIFMKQHFGIKEIQGTPTRTNHIGRNILQSPVCVAVAARMVKLIEVRIHGSVSEYDMLNLAYLVFQLLDICPFEKKKVNLILIAENSKFAVRPVVRRLKESIGDYLERIDISEVYELRNMDLERYAGVLTAHTISNFDFPLKLIKIDYFLSSAECRKIFQSVILNQQDWFDFLPAIHPDDIYRDYQVESMEEFLKILAFRHFRSQTDSLGFQEIFIRYSTRYRLHGYNKIMVLCNLAPERQNTVEVFRLEKTMNWNDNPIKYVIYLSVKTKSKEQLKILELLARMLVRDPAFIESLVEGNTENFYRNVIGAGVLQN